MQDPIPQMQRSRSCLIEVLITIAISVATAVGILIESIRDYKELKDLFTYLIQPPLLEAPIAIFIGVLTSVVLWLHIRKRMKAEKENNRIERRFNKIERDIMRHGASVEQIGDRVLSIEKEKDERFKAYEKEVIDRAEKLLKKPKSDDD